MHVTPRALEAADLDEVRVLQPQDWQDIVPNLRFYVTSPFCRPVKVVHDGRIVGIGASVLFVKTAWLAHIIVHPAWRNKGVGSAIVQALLDDLNRTGHETVSLTATALGRPVYQHAGFRDVAEYVFLRGPLIAAREGASEHLAPFHDAFRTEILELDMRASGEERAELLEQHLPTAVLYVERSRLRGFFLPDAGEGAVAAETLEAGLALIEMRCCRKQRVVVLRDNRPCLDFLGSHGYVETGTATRMVRGPDIDYRPDMLFARIGGNVG